MNKTLKRVDVDGVKYRIVKGRFGGYIIQDNESGRYADTFINFSVPTLEEAKKMLEKIKKSGGA